MSDSDGGAPVRNRVRRTRRPQQAANDGAKAADPLAARAPIAEEEPLDSGAGGVAESKSRDRGDGEKESGLAKEDQPLLGQDGPKTPPKPEKPKKPTRFGRGGGESGDVGGAGSSSSGAGGISNNNSNSSSAQSDAVSQAMRSQQGPMRSTWFSFLSKSVCCKIGYRMEPFYRDARLGESRFVAGDARTNSFLVGAVIENVFANAAFVTGLVRPAVRVHCVYLDSGLYVKGGDSVPAPPVTTGPCPLTQPSAMPYWHETLPIAAPFLETASSKTLLLFELLDDRPSLKPTKQAKRRAYKRIAWGYLLPVGTRGQLNVGIKEDWKPASGSGSSSSSSSSSFPSGPRRNRRDEERNVGGDDEEKDGAEGSNEAQRPDSDDLPLRVQLFSYASTDGAVGALQRGMLGWPALVPTGGHDNAYPDGVPSVYVQWRRQRLLPIDGAMLAVSLGPRPSAPTALPVLQAGKVESSTQRGSVNDEMTKYDLSRVKTAAIKRSRSAREACVLPDRLLHRLDPGPEGAMVVSFSHSGHLLAVAAKSAQAMLPFAGQATTSPYPGNSFALRLIDTDVGTEVWIDAHCHAGVVYDAKWSLDDTYLVTCSGDGTIKVWDVLSVSPLAARAGADSFIPFAPGVVGTVSPSKRGSSSSTSAFLPLDDKSLPRCIHTLQCTPPTFTYAAIFQEYSPLATGVTANSMSVGMGVAQDDPVTRGPLPRILSGGADGRIRVWDGATPKGFVVVKGGVEGNLSLDQPPAHTDAFGKPCRVQALVIDERSRYLLSGSSNHDIYVWKRDEQGWYQLQRTFKQDPVLKAALQSSDAVANALRPGAGVTSLCMHPERARSQVLALSSGITGLQLRLLSTSTYKNVNTFGGAGASASADGKTTSFFSRATLSADGRFAVCCVQGEPGTPLQGKFVLRAWDSVTGAVVSDFALGSVPLPFAVRSISWHPRQHVVAVAMVGPGASVNVFCGERESANMAVSRLYSASALGLSELISGKGQEDVGESQTGSLLQGKSQSSSSVGLEKSATSEAVRALARERREQIAARVQAV